MDKFKLSNFVLLFERSELHKIAKLKITSEMQR